MNVNVLLCAVTLLTSYCGLTSAVYFEEGYDHHYTYTSTSDVLGMHNVTTVIKFRVCCVNGTSDRGRLHKLLIDSFVQHSEHGYTADNPLNWHLDHSFYFTVGHEGLVQLVHYHPEELYEVLALKKVLASTIATHVQVGEGLSWQYESEEEDHAGTLSHKYEGTRLADGVKLVRSHQSLTDVHRLHNKTVHMDTRLTPQHVEVLDNITLQHTPNKVTTHTMEGVAKIEEDMSGEFPIVSTISRSTAMLVVKNKLYEPPTPHLVNEMHNDSISVKMRPPVKKPLREVEKDMQRYLQCIHAIENKYDRNRTECVHQLRTLVRSLERDDFLKLGRDALSKQCPENDTICADERNLFIGKIPRTVSSVLLGKVTATSV